MSEKIHPTSGRQPPKIIISSRIFIPQAQADEAILQEHYEISQYNDAACHRCEVYKNGERHAPACDVCPQFKGINQLWRKVKYKDQRYIALPPAQPQQIERLFNVDLQQADDRRPIIPMQAKLRFTGKLYQGEIIRGRQTVDQVKMAKRWLKRKTGIIEVPPRGGKTLIAAYDICKLGVKTIIICSRRALLRQFRRTFQGDAKYPAQTNARSEARRLGHPVIGLVDKMADFAGLDVAMVNYQKFIRNKRSIAKIFEYINNQFSLLVVDECHDSGAAQYIKFIARLNCRYRMGLSATPDRKDGMSQVIKQYLGSTVARSTTTAMIPEIELVETGVVSKYKYRSWPYAMRFLACDNKREAMILREIFNDLQKNQHAGIIIPVDFVAQGKALVDKINKKAAELSGTWPEQTAAFYSRAVGDETVLNKILKRLDNGKHRVVVAIRTMFKVGIDLSRPTALYIVVPMSASAEVGAPMFYQLSHRVSTWAENKRQPVVKVFIDGIPQSFYCFKSLFWKEILPGLRNADGKSARYKMQPDEFQRAIMLAKQKDYTPANAHGKRVSSANLMHSNKPKTTERQRGFSAMQRVF